MKIVLLSLLFAQLCLSNTTGPLAIGNKQLLDEACRADSDCNGFPFEQCRELGSMMRTCQHKDVFPILGVEFIGLALLTMVTSISTVGGIGGGGLVIPFCMTFFGFQTKHAIALSGFTIFSCSVVRFLFFLHH